MKELMFRMYEIRTPFGETSIVAMDLEYDYIKINPEQNTSFIDGYSYSYGNLTDGVNEVKNNSDNAHPKSKGIIKGIPLGLSKDDIVKIIELEVMRDNTRAIRSDSFTTIKNPVISVSTDVDIKDMSEAICNSIRKMNENKYI